MSLRWLVRGAVRLWNSSTGDLGEEGLKRSVLVVATSNQSAMMRSKCTMTATTIAEYFKDQGMDVLLMMDSLTRFAMAQRGGGAEYRRTAGGQRVYPIHLFRAS